MADHSKIEWTETTWNPVTGCTKISDGCQNCYAERLAKRLKAMGNSKYCRAFEVVCHPDVLDAPRTWRRPRMVFVNSMGDLFHRDVPDRFIEDVFATMRATPHHTYQLLTKRSERLAQLAGELKWPRNLWLGVTVESAAYLHRIDELRTVPARLRFLSCEPLLGPLGDVNLDGIGWVIAGGESGPEARPMEADWVRSLRDHCGGQGVPFFFKQWGGFNKKKAGRSLDGEEWLQYPRL